MARIGVMRALHRHRHRDDPSPRATRSALCRANTRKPALGGPGKRGFPANTGVGCAISAGLCARTSPYPAAGGPSPIARATRGDTERRTGTLEDELKQRDRRIEELREDNDKQTDLINRLREHVEDIDSLLENWRVTFEMKLGDDGRWSWDDWWKEHNDLIGLSMIAMHLSHTFHPPAGIDPLVVVVSDMSWDFLFVPV
jgi:hypothetical protein